MNREEEKELNKTLMMMTAFMMNLDDRLKFLEDKHETVNKGTAQSRARNRQKTKKPKKV